ncbi:hypothetical protein PENPOL_c015G05517 [Penicillium polonicum]|uniref:Uncharacterized protein n=1 Tax=Penicillium polonicum TaxID=60169 RepID=A0A1V6NAX8_PENPO|nr:hypothetical protein PENPOL_c015G05517 [Penicillium polonicum]
MSFSENASDLGGNEFLACYREPVVSPLRDDVIRLERYNVCSGVRPSCLLPFGTTTTNMRVESMKKVLTVFHIAVEYDNKSITGLLSAYGALDINAPDANGATALCLAAAAKHTPIVLQILAEDHVDISVAGQTGRTALHHAASTGNIPIACVLIAKEDLDPNIRDDQGRPSLTYAALDDDSRIVELFLHRRLLIVVIICHYLKESLN